MHLCHLNSTSGRQSAEVARAVTTAAAQGLNVTGEAYPYGAGATEIGAAFLAPENLPRLAIDHSDVHLLLKGRAVRDRAEYDELRSNQPTTDVIVNSSTRPIPTTGRHSSARCCCRTPRSPPTRSHRSLTGGP